MSSYEPVGRETTEVARLDFILISATVFWISGLLGVGLLMLHVPLSANPHDLDDPAKLTDLLVVAIALSGITLPVIIAYLSLGRSRDIFSEIGDAISFFLSEVGLNKADLRTAAQKHGLAQEVKSDILAINHLSELRNASGVHLPPADKVQLLRHMPFKLRRKYFYYLNEENDQILLRWHALHLGISSLPCLFLIFYSHLNRPVSLFVFLSHWAPIMAVFANLCSYYFLLKLARWRGRLQTGVARRVKEICHGMLQFVEPAMTAQDDVAQGAADRVIDSAEKLKKLP